MAAPDDESPKRGQHRETLEGRVEELKRQISDRQEFREATAHAMEKATQQPVHDQLQTIASVGIADTPPQYMNTHPSGHEMNVADGVTSTLFAVGAAASAGKQAYEEFRRSADERVDQAIRNNPPSSQEQHDNDLLEEIRQADLAKHEQRAAGIEKFPGMERADAVEQEQARPDKFGARRMDGETEPALPDKKLEQPELEAPERLDERDDDFGR